jgi:glucosamine 6-phosphate synthetase-like amidotransferase/phosphosugar isomerase protein
MADAAEFVGYIDIAESISGPFESQVYAAAVQLLGYYFAILMGKDGDLSTNLAKSVTVE